jgi:predicted DNA-binding transcriptional regulator AlpA
MNTEDYSVQSWCKRRGICVATFYNRLKHGEMPKIIKIGRRTIITAEADQEWRHRMEAIAAGRPTQEGDQP